MGFLILIVYALGIIAAYLIIDNKMDEKPEWEKAWYSLAWPSTLIMYILYLLTRDND